MRKPIVLSATFLTAIASIALAQQAQNERAQQQQQAQQQDPQMEQQEYVRHCASDNQFEIQASQFVEQRTQDQQIKQVAQRFAQDHQRAQQQLQQVAQQLNIQITDQLLPVQQAKLEELQKKQGQSLDREFVFGQVADHHKDILENEYQSAHAENPQIKQFAQQQVPVLREHLRLAMQAAEQYVPEAREAGERIRGNRTSEQPSPRGASGSINPSGDTAAGRTAGNGR